ncbi:response regulator [Telmatospirillum sp.]|uniref:response regulator n=1 Tax=Telmatospirillum sp. TaxID=2079197 RepID=UPI00283F1BD9|nr:response regulator [Telmatospirillum sp.]MDR3441291.1 response regulator [Telmatospirillum sp.]
MTEAPATGSDLPPLNILLAEDNLISQKLAMAMLSRHGHTVTVVGDGKAALDAVQSGTFDAVLMDIQMPEMDGLDATRAIRALPGDKGALPVIAMTAGSGDDDAERCQAAGMDGHIAKPFDLAKVFALLRRCLDDRAGR